jgi:hypothetical protein
MRVHAQREALRSQSNPEQVASAEPLPNVPEKLERIGNIVKLEQLIPGDRDGRSFLGFPS